MGIFCHILGVRLVRFRRSRGTTLIEVLISTAIFSFVIISIFLVFRLGTNYWKAIRVQKILQDSAKYAIDDMYKELKRTNKNTVTYVSFKNNDPDFHRDILIFFSSTNWFDSNLYNSNDGTPLWNEVIIYFATPAADINSISTISDLERNVYGSLYKIIIPLNDAVETSVASDISKNICNTLATSNPADPQDLISKLGGISQLNIDNRRVKRIIPPGFSGAQNTLYSFSVNNTDNNGVCITSVESLDILIDVRRVVPQIRVIGDQRYFKEESIKVTLKVMPQW